MMQIVGWQKSPNPRKKYRVTLSNGDQVDFGALKKKNGRIVGYEHYRDSTPLKLYTRLDHNDPERLRRYRARHRNIKLKDGTPAYTKKFSPSWLSWSFLWS